MTKSPEALRTITEVAQRLGVKPHVLRFWEGKFPQLRPIQRLDGRRYYRPSDVARLLGLRALLHDQETPIATAQALLRRHGLNWLAQQATPRPTAPPLMPARALPAAPTPEAMMSDETSTTLPPPAPQAQLPGIELRPESRPVELLGPPSPNTAPPTPRAPRLRLRAGRGHSATNQPMGDSAAAHAANESHDPAPMGDFFSTPTPPLNEKTSTLDQAPPSQIAGTAAADKTPIATRIRRAPAHIWLENIAETQEALTRIWALQRRLGIPDSNQYAFEE